MQKRKRKTVEEVTAEQLGHETNMMSTVASKEMEELSHDDTKIASPTKSKEMKQLFDDTEIASPVTSEEMNEADDVSEVSTSEEERRWQNFVNRPPSPITPTNYSSDDDQEGICSDEDDKYKKMKPGGDLNFLTVAENAGWWLLGNLFERVDKLPDYKREYASLLFHLRKNYGEVECKFIRTIFDGYGGKAPGFDSLSSHQVACCLEHFLQERRLIDELTAARQFSLDLKHYITESKSKSVDVYHKLEKRFPRMWGRDLWGAVVFRIYFLRHQQRYHSQEKEKCRVPECEYDEVIMKLYDRISDMFKTDEYFLEYELLRFTYLETDWRLKLLDVLKIPHDRWYERALT